MGERYNKTIDDLEIKDNFMFAAVMLDEENAKELLELVLDVKIDHVEVVKEKSIIYHPEYKSVRLDVYVRDDKGSHFDVEMQVERTETALRSRYYHSMLDVEILESGKDYLELPDAYVIFICDYDPIGLGKYKYTVRKTLAEDVSFEYNDRSHTVFLSTVGMNEGEVLPSLKNFLQYVGGKASLNDKTDNFVERLQKSVAKVKSDREMRNRYMLFEEIKKEEYKAGKEEGLKEGLKEGRNMQYIAICNILEGYGPVSDELKTRIQTIEDGAVLVSLTTIAARVKSISDFEEEMRLLNC